MAGHKPDSNKALAPVSGSRGSLCDAIESVLAAPGRPARSRDKRMRRCATGLLPTRWTRCQWTASGTSSRRWSRSHPHRCGPGNGRPGPRGRSGRDRAKTRKYVAGARRRARPRCDGRSEPGRGINRMRPPAFVSVVPGAWPCEFGGPPLPADAPPLSWRARPNLYGLRQCRQRRSGAGYRCRRRKCGSPASTGHAEGHDIFLTCEYRPTYGRLTLVTESLAAWSG